MIEQMNLFGERDVLMLVCETLKSRYAWITKRGLCDEKIRPFAKWVLDCFSSYQGGTTPAELKAEGYDIYGCSPKGMELWNGTEKTLIPKSKIMRTLGITDDNKDVLRGDAE